MRALQRVGEQVRLAAILLAVGISSAWSQSLYVIEDGSDAVVGGLLDAGHTVSSRLSGACFVYGAAEVPAAARRLGAVARLLDPVVAGSEHYLVSAAALQRATLPASSRQLGQVADVIVVAAPAGNTPPLLGLRHEFRKLFPRPMRLPPSISKPLHPPILAGVPNIAELVAQVSAESLSNNVFLLEAFGSRNAVKAGGQMAAEWLAARFRGFGIEQVEIRQWSSMFAGNVVATLPGQVNPQDVYVFGGHYDSIVPNSDYEPGADDNASGTATLLELARLLATRQMSSTVIIVAFGAEEFGLFGSEAFAARARMYGENIIGMVNFDMLGYRAPGDRRDLDVVTNTPSEWLMQAAFDAAASYVPDLRALRGKLNFGRSDHESFWEHGFPAIFLFEDSSSPSPFIHSIDDVIGVSYTDPTLHAQATRVAVALAATLAGAYSVPIVLESFTVHRHGARVRLQWSLAASAENGIEGIVVERAPVESGAWERRTMQALPPGTREFVDSAAREGEDWWYRLTLLGTDGRLFALPAIQALGNPSRPTAIEAAYTPVVGGPLHVHAHLAAPTARLRVGVYDVRGRILQTLHDGAASAGTALLTWDHRDGSGIRVASGIYFLDLRTSDAHSIRKVLVLLD